MSTPLEIIVTGNVDGAKSGLQVIQGELVKTVSSTKNAGAAFDEMNAKMQQFQRAANSSANLLEFLTRSLNWLEDYDNERVKENQNISNGTFFIRLLFEQLLHPWLKEKRNNIPGITSGLKEIQ
ncbi:MAG TPA: hypothetical protein VMU83_21620 [Hanamia sp.]|nr:hypothetical protein [Hanamia sp.]